ncbi:MAG: TlpA family protein disulfide reductase [Actinomycetota bacterium]|nr:TlpA family protein disulfide reductase [Actinomycetota bacterium]
MRAPRLLPGNRIVRARAWLMSLMTAILALAGCTSGADGADDGRSAEQELQGVPDLTDCPDPTGQPATGEQTLPELRLPCLDATGGQLTVGEAPGIPMVVTLWATWCGPCRDELPLLSQLFSASDRGQLLVAGVVTRDGAGLAAEFVEDLDIAFPSGFDENGDLYAGMGLRGLPAAFFVNADGSIAHAELAPIASYEELVGLVQEHLGVTV